VSAASVSPVDPTQSPEERLDGAVREIRSSVASELLESIMGASPKFFEVLVLDLLHAMGYGTSRADLQRVGGSGDGGIDGIISLDRLGLEKVYVQAKRWQNSVGRPDVQGFYGALAGQRSKRGVFITTSTFTAQAIRPPVALTGRQLSSDRYRLGRLGCAMRPRWLRRRSRSSAGALGTCSVRSLSRAIADGAP
jgi:restriction endonuclease Mrr